MKTLLQTLALFGVLLTGAGLNPARSVAQEPAAQPVCVEQVGEFVYLVRVSNPAQITGRLQLVRDADGAVLYDKTSLAPAFGERLNVSNLPDGRYAVVVRLGHEVRRFGLNLNTTQQRQARLISLATPR